MTEQHCPGCAPGRRREGGTHTMGTVEHPESERVRSDAYDAGYVAGKVAAEAEVARLREKVEALEAGMQSEIEYLDLPNGPHRYTKGFHDGDCPACGIRQRLRALTSEQEEQS